MATARGMPFSTSLAARLIEPVNKTLSAVPAVISKASMIDTPDSTNKAKVRVISVKIALVFKGPKIGILREILSKNVLPEGVRRH